MTAARAFVRGLGWPFVGLAFVVVRPRLYPWVVLPAVSTLALMGSAWLVAWSWIPPLLHRVWPRPGPGLVQDLWDGSALFLVFWAFATAVLLLYAAFGVVGAPFYDRLSQAVERITHPADAEPFAWRAFLTDVTISAWHSLIATVLWLAVLVVLLALSAIPVVGTILEIGVSLLFTAWFIAREMMDGIASRRRWSFGQKVRLIARNLAMMTGFGLAVTVLVAIPFVNIVAWPAAVAAGTLMFLELERG